MHFPFDRMHIKVSCWNMKCIRPGGSCVDVAVLDDKMLFNLVSRAVGVIA